MTDGKISPKIILVVDDEQSIRQLIKTHLESEGYAVLTAGTAKEALETVKRMKLCAVLLDLGLPDIDGLEVLWNVKMIQPSLCVIMVTGCHEESRGRRAIELGAWDYVTKPINFESLKNALRLISSGT